jgi:hypothetical protein
VDFTKFSSFNALGNKQENAKNRKRKAKHRRTRADRKSAAYLDKNEQSFSEAEEIGFSTGEEDNGLDKSEGDVVPKLKLSDCYVRNKKTKIG